MNRRLKPYLKYLEELGVRLLDTEPTGSGHYKLTVTRRGSHHFFIISKSGSDRRSFENWKSDVRKWVRSNETADQKDYRHGPRP